MEPGDDVVLLADPLAHGIGEILEVTRAGRLLVRFDDDHTSDHDAHELETLARWMTAA